MSSAFGRRAVFFTVLLAVSTPMDVEARDDLVTLQPDVSAASTSIGEASPSARLPNELVPRFESAPKAILVPPSRAQVVTLYNTNYLAGQSMPAMNWTGNVASCNPGAVSLAYQQSMIDRVNVFRAIARISPVSLYAAADDKDERTAAAALLMAANNSLSHSPPSSWTCFNQAFAGSTVGALGADGAGSSNLALSGNNAYATNAVIDAYVDDSGAGNVEVGHRTGLFDAKQTLMATGVIPSGAGNGAANALWWINFATRSGPTPTPEGVAWPPNGFIPYQLLPKVSNRWSFQYPGANFSAATVTMTSGGAAYAPVAYDFRSTGCPTGFTCLPDDAIVWRPPLDAGGINGVFYTSPGAVDKTYTVNITGVTGSGVPSSFSYTVTVIDPAVAVPVTISGTISNGGGVSGVTFCARPSAGVTCTTSNGAGAYSCTVPSGWTGTLYSPVVGGNRIPAQVFATGVASAVSRNVTAKTSASFACNLDVDNNGLFEPAIDGVAILRRMNGFAEITMAGLSGTCAQNTSTSALFSAANPANFNVTGGASVLPATDGIVLLRAMQGFTGSPVTQGIGLSSESGATRTIWGTGSDGQIRAWLNSTCGTDF